MALGRSSRSAELPGSFKAPPRRQTPIAEEDAIDPALLDTIPDVPAGHDAAHEFHALMQTLEDEMHGLVSQEFARLQESLVSGFADIEGRLARAQQEIARLEAANAQHAAARERYERAFATLKDLARAVDDTST